MSNQGDAAAFAEGLLCGMVAGTIAALVLLNVVLRIL